MTFKICTKCKQSKNINCYGNRKTKNKTIYKNSICKECVAKFIKNWKTINKPLKEKRVRRIPYEYYLTSEGRAKSMYSNVNSRAKKLNVLNLLTKEWIIENLIKGICAVTKIPFILKSNIKNHTENSFAPSIDRIDQTGPYSPENCQMTCWIYNRAKGAFPIEDLHKMINALRNMEII